jgi:sterol desaturase/sphingolipid hydroxylase (fatty acid hydroxylase superfamily)
MLSELKSSAALLQYYLTWLVNMSSGGAVIVALALFFALLVIIEFYYPYIKRLATNSEQSYKANIELFVFNNFVISIFSIPSLLILAERNAGNGLLADISNPLWKAALSFLAIDFLLYLLHKASHHFEWLWLFHRVHHNDSYLNVSTAFRIHLLEIIMITFMKAVLIIVLGIELNYLVACDGIITFFTMLHHANISFRGERLLGWIIITPYLHRAHHSTLRSEHDRNYGAVLSIWDRLFGTLAELKPVELGIQGYSSQELIHLLSCGLIMANRSPTNAADNLDEMIAEAAYYKAEKRGFSPGNELRDWLEAKSEIINLVYGKEQLKYNMIQKWRNWTGYVKNALNGSNQKYPLFWKQIN